MHQTVHRYGIGKGGGLIVSSTKWPPVKQSMQILNDGLGLANIEKIVFKILKTKL